MRRPGELGGVGKRVLILLIVVTLVAVATVSLAAAIGSTRGIAAQHGAQQDALLEQVAFDAATAYEQAGSWEGADLTEVLATARAGGAGITITTPEGEIVESQGRGGGRGRMGDGGRSSENSSGLAEEGHRSGPVIAAGEIVGAVTLAFGTADESVAHDIAWTWILVGAALAVAFAVAAAFVAARMVSRPLRDLVVAARRMAAGDYTASVPEHGFGEIADLADAFDAAASAVRAAQDRQRQQAADIAHELRTPLTAMRAEVEELRDGLVEATPAALDRIHTHTLRLARTVDDLAELASADAASFQVRRRDVDLSELVREACGLHSAALTAAGMTLVTQIAPGIAIQADSDRLHQVLANLIGNAARHCRPGDQVTVQLSAEPGYARIEVADDGPGIDPAVLPRATERFWRGPTDAVGSGLGLPVVQGLIDAHGGTFELHSDGHHGTLALVRLPLSPGSGPTPGRSGPLPPPPPGS